VRLEGPLSQSRHLIYFVGQRHYSGHRSRCPRWHYFLYQESPTAFAVFLRTRVPSLRTRPKCLLSLGLGESLVGGGLVRPNETLARVLVEPREHRVRWSLGVTSRPCQHVSDRTIRRHQKYPLPGTYTACKLFGVLSLCNINVLNPESHVCPELPRCSFKDLKLTLNH